MSRAYNGRGTGRRISWLLGGALGGFFALVVVAIDYIGSYFAGLPRFSFLLFDWLARVLPGSILTFFIHNMVTTINQLQLGQTSVVAKQLEQLSGIVFFVVVGILFGILLALAGRNRPFSLGPGGWIGGGILSGLFVAIQISMGFPDGRPVLFILWTVFILTGFGALLGYTLQAIAAPRTVTTAQGMTRRQFLWIVGAGSLTVLVTAAGVDILSRPSSIPQTGGAAQTPSPTPPSAGELASAANTSGPAQSPPLSALQSRFQPVPGTRPELTSNDNFYRIDIDLVPPAIDGSSWQLELGGLVDHPLKLSLADLRARPSISQAITLECISNPLGGDLTSTTVYTGVPLKDILAEAGLQPGAQDVSMEAADGFYESMPLAEAMDERTLLVYEMNGQPLLPAHGYPVRVYIPNHFGMKQPKWLTKMTVIDHPGAGYWVDRGWNAQAIPPVTSVIDTVDTQDFNAQAGIVPVGGIAYAGARGISRVEVQVDDGAWVAAELRDPPLSPLTWVQWRYRWQAQPGQHTFRVRATDGDGHLQIAQVAPPEPDGATGIYSASADIP